jgi:site-specific DNA-cytosine methylase
MPWYTKSRRSHSDDDYETWIEGGVMPTLNMFDSGDVRTTVLVGCFEMWDFPKESVAPTMTSKRARDLIAYPTGMRRLMPIECERLQGFPDNWTDGQSDSRRYKQIGNAVAVPVVEWIIGNIIETTKSPPPEVSLMRG